MSIQAPKLLDLTRAPLDAVPILGRLAPNTSASLEFEFAIDPATPAGEYPATLNIGGERHDAQIKVDNHVELGLQPDAITLFAGDRTEFECEFELANIGNVALPLGGQWDAVLTPAEGAAGMLMRALAGLAGVTEEGLARASLDEVLHACSRQCPGLVEVNWGDARLAVGETRMVSATVKLPGGMPRNRHYVARLDLYSTELRFDIHTRS
jgi:hypothetical protein